jgi:hypothetical protein
VDARRLIFGRAGGDHLASEDVPSTRHLEEAPDDERTGEWLQYEVVLRYHRHPTAGHGRHSDGESEILLHPSDDGFEVPAHHSDDEIEAPDHHSGAGIELHGHHSDVPVESRLMVWVVAEEECFDLQHSVVDECLVGHDCDAGLLILDRPEIQGSLSGRRNLRDRFGRGCNIHDSHREGDVWSQKMGVAIVIWGASAGT